MDWSSAARAQLAGRVVVITGASAGVGRAFAQAMAPTGATFVLLARREPMLVDVARQVEAAGSRADVQVVDLRDGQAASAAAARTIEAWGIPDVVIANAGHSIARTALECAERPDSISRTIAVNYEGAVRHLLGFLPGMAERHDGSIIGITSATTRIAAPGWGPYQASKAGFDMWLRCAAEELRPQGVRVTTIALPLVRTAMSAPTYGTRPRGSLSASEAAAWIARGLVTGAPRIAPLWSKPIEVVSSLSPTMTTRIIGAYLRSRSR